MQPKPSGHVTQLSPPEANQRPRRFVYATGDKPLEGYTLKRGIGGGGFGEVYYGTSDGGKEVALKLIQRHLDVELRGVSHCLNLKHPHLVALYDVRQAENGDTWVVMEYMTGEGLQERIAAHPEGMPVPEIMGLVRGICAGVGHLHEQGIVHRDLKPGNIFLEGGQVKIGDYGLAKFISASRRSGQTESVGTVFYMAPELSRGRYGKEIDLYALGVILFEMLTGRVPFDGESPGEILMKHLTVEPDLSGLAPVWRGVLSRLLAKDPQVRYSTVESLLADLPTESGAPQIQAPVRMQLENIPPRPVASPRPSPQGLAATPLSADPHRGHPGEHWDADSTREYWTGAARVIVQLVIGLFFAVGLGITTGVLLEVVGLTARSEFMVLSGVAAGCLSLAVFLFMGCRRLQPPHRFWPVLVGLLTGTGVGMICAVVGHLTGIHEELATLLGAGLGCLSAAVMTMGQYRVLRTSAGWWMPIMVVLAGAGVGMSTAGLAGLPLGLYSDAVPLVGVASGCLVAGGLGYWFVIRRVDHWLQSPRGGRILAGLRTPGGIPAESPVERSLPDVVTAIPFQLSSHGGLAEAHGLLKRTDLGLLLEFQVADCFLGVLKSAVKEVIVPFRQLGSLQFREGWWDAQVIISAATVRDLTDVPESKGGRVELKVARHDRELARRFVMQAIEQANLRV